MNNAALWNSLCFVNKLTFIRMLLAGIATGVLVLIGVGIWCAWRFLKKKRPQGQEMAVDDEQDLIGNEEAEPEEVEADPANNDFKGRIHYRLEYDFTTQELKVTVSGKYKWNPVGNIFHSNLFFVQIIECSDLPPTDWSTGLTDPFVKLYLLPDKKPKYETKVHRKNLNPKFDQTFVFKNLPYV